MDLSGLPQTPLLSLGALPRTRAFGVGGRFLGPGRQAWARPHDTSLYLLCGCGSRGVACVGFSFCICTFYFMNGLHSGPGRGAEAPILPADAGAWDVQDHFLSRPEPRPPGLRLLGRRLRLQEAGPLPEPQTPPLTLLPIYTGLSQSPAATPPQGPAPLAAAFVTSLHAAPAPCPFPFPELPAPSPS